MADRPSLRMRNTVGSGLKRGLRTYLKVIRVMIPVYMMVTLLQQTPLMADIAHLGRPLMRLFGLPGEAVVVLFLGFFNLYSALPVLASFSFTVQEVTVIGTMAGIAHSLPVETMIVKQARVPGLPVLAARLGLAIIAGLILRMLFGM